MRDIGLEFVDPLLFGKLLSPVVSVVEMAIIRRPRYDDTGSSWE